MEKANRIWQTLRRFWPLTILASMVINFTFIWFLADVNWDLAIDIGTKIIWFYVGLGVYIGFKIWSYLSEEYPDWDDLTFEEKAYVRELERQNARDMINRGEMPKRVRKFLR